MQIEQMEEVLADFVLRHSTKMGQPLRQRFSLVKESIGLKVGQEIIEVGIDLILAGADLEELVERMMHLNWTLYHKAREEKRRVIEKEKQLAAAHINELKRYCPTEEFHAWISTFIPGRVAKREE